MNLFLSGCFLQSFYFNSEMIPPAENLEEAAKYSVDAANVLTEMVRKHPDAVLDFESALADENFKEAVDEYLGWMGFQTTKKQNMRWMPDALQRFNYYIKSNPRVQRMLNDMASEIYRPIYETRLSRTIH